MFIPVEDRNTRMVYEWVRDDGERALVPVDQWKTREEWDQEDIEALFHEELEEEFDEDVADEVEYTETDDIPF